MFPSTGKVFTCDTCGRRYRYDHRRGHTKHHQTTKAFNVAGSHSRTAKSKSEPASFRAASETA